MPTNFVSLNCKNCGGKLEVYPDMEYFVCGSCGSAMLAQRHAGTVVLKAVAAAIGKVQIGTDKTAAEPALVRLHNELSGLRPEYVNTASWIRVLGPGHGDGFLDKLFNLLLGKPSRAPILRLQRIQERIVEVERQIAKNRMIIDG